MGRKSKASAEFFQPGGSATDDAAEDRSTPEAAAAGTTGKASRQTSRSLHHCQKSDSKQEAVPSQALLGGSNAVCLALQGVLQHLRQLCH